MSEQYSKIQRAQAITALAGAFFAAGYVGFIRNRGNPELTQSARQQVYEARVAGMDLRERYLAEFITGMVICNPSDKNNLISMLGLTTGSETCGVLMSEADERIGRTCLKGTSYDTSYANGRAELHSGPNDGQATIRPALANQYELHLQFTAHGAAATDPRTALILHDYGCKP